MMRKCFSARVVAAVCVLLLLAGTQGCGKKQSPAQKPQETAQQSKNQVPESFTRMVAATETLIVDLAGKTRTVQMRGLQTQGQSAASGQEGQQGQGQTGQQNQQSGQGQQTGQQNQQSGQGQQPGQQNQQPGQQSQQGGQQNQPGGQNQPNQTGQQGQGQTQQGQTGQAGQNQGNAGQNNQNQASPNAGQPSGSVWKQSQTVLKELHQDWNSLEPDAARAGLTLEARDGFEKVLEDLTRKISAQNAEAGLASAVELYKTFSDMAGALRTDLPPSYYRLKYEMMAATVQAGLGRWEEAKSHTAGFKQQEEMLKTKETEDNAQLFAQLDNGLNDLYRAVEIKEKDLVFIKSEIALKNLEQLKEKLSGSSAQQKGSGSSG